MIYKEIEVFNDGTVIIPNLHDLILKEYNFSQDNFMIKIIDRFDEKIIYNLIFPKTEIIKINIQNDFMIFRFSSFNLNSNLEGFFYLKQALDLLDFNSIDELLADIGKSNYINYIEGLGGYILTVSKNPLFSTPNTP